MKQPKLHPNFFKACLQLFFWVFFKPFTLRLYIDVLKELEKSLEKRRIFKIISIKKTNSSIIERYNSISIATIILAPCLIVFPIILVYQISFEEIDLLITSKNILKGMITGITVFMIVDVRYGIKMAGYSITMGLTSSIFFSLALNLEISEAYITVILFTAITGYLTNYVPSLPFAGILIGIVFIIGGNVALHYIISNQLIMITINFLFLLVHYRIYYYCFELPFHLVQVFLCWIIPDRTLNILRYSPVFWDERIWFPLPSLDNMLRKGFKQDKKEGMERIEQVSQSFMKFPTACSALAWITADTLKESTTITSLIENTKQVNWLPENLEDLGKDAVEIFPNLQGISRGLSSSLNTDLYNRRLSLRDALEHLYILDSRTKHLGRLAVERWQPVIEQWQKIISDELMTLSISNNETENPYQPGNPLQLTRKILFKGRQNLKDTVVNSLLERNRPTLVLHGPRRMGKTSFLLQLPALLPGHTIPVFVDLQRPARTQNTTSFLYHIARAISRDARPYRLIIPSPKKEEFTDSPFEAFETWIEDICLPILKNFNILLTFDEFEKLGEAIEKGKIDHEILDELRHLIQHQTQMAFLFAGVRTMEDLGPDWSSYFINIKPVSISYLLPEEARSLITDPDPEANFTLKYDEEVVNQIINMTCCHPYLVQLVCSAIVEEANAAKTNYVDLPLLDKAVIRSLQQGEPYFRNVWDEMASQSGQTVLRQIAISEKPLDLHEADSNIQIALSRMVKLKVLTKNDGTYEVEVPLVKKWILELAPVG